MGIDENTLLNSELTIIGTMLRAPEIVGLVLSETSESDFWHAEYRTIYKTIKALFAENKPTDAIMLHEVLGKAYDKVLLTCFELTVSTQTWRAHAEEMRKQTRVYKLQAIGQQIAVCKSDEEAQEYMAQANNLFCNNKDQRVVSIAQGLVDFWDRQETKKEYLHWGIDHVDTNLYADKGDFIIIGGRPSAGKTALALNFADYMSRENKVGFFSLETNSEKIFDRFFTQRAKLSFSNVKKHELNAIEKAMLLEQTSEIKNRRFDVIRANGMSVQDIAAITLSRKYDIIFIDYVQLVRSTGHNRTEEVSRISMGLHNLAQHNGVTVVALAQLARPGKGEAMLAPTMASLKESGQLEQDADSIMLLYLTKPSDTKSDRVLKFAKNKEGSTGATTLTFEGIYQKFRHSSANSKHDAMAQQGFAEVAVVTPFESTGD